MGRKRQITIVFVTDDETTASSVISAVSHLVDDMTVTSKALGGKPGRLVRRTKMEQTGSKVEEVNKAGSHEPLLVYSAANPETPHRRNIDVEASIRKLGLTREQLTSQRWPRGSAQHRLKRAAAKLVGAGPDPAIRQSKSNGASRT